MSTLQDRIMGNYEKALEEGRTVLIRACTLFLKGDSVADKFIGLSHSEKKKLYFNEAQIKTVESGCKLENMDTSLLYVITRAFGGLDPGPLQDHLKELKDLRNNLAHDKHSLKLNKRDLKAKLAELKTLLTAILNELKAHCTPTEGSILDHDITRMESQLVSLEKILDDHIVEKTYALVYAAAKANTQIENSSSSLDISLKNTAASLKTQMSQFTSTLDQSLTQTVKNLNTHVNQSSAALDLNINKAIANLSAQIDQHSSKFEQNLNNATVNLHTHMSQSSATLEKHLNETAKTTSAQMAQSSSKLDHSAEAINQSTFVLEKKITELEEVTSKMSQITLNNGSDFSKYSSQLQHLATVDNQVKKGIPTPSCLSKVEVSILQFISKAIQPVCTNDIVKALGLKSKSEINATLYKFMKEKLIQKVSESPPLWQALSKECLATQKEENLTSNGRMVLGLLLKSADPVKPQNLSKATGLSRSEINNLLYSMQEKGLAEKVKDIPPLWRVSEFGRKDFQEKTSHNN